MTPQQSLIAALEGEVPETTPLTIYDWNMGAVTPEELAEKMQQPAWRRAADLVSGKTGWIYRYHWRQLDLLSARDGSESWYLRITAWYRVLCLNLSLVTWADIVTFYLCDIILIILVKYI